ncbi:hypothetical protein LTR47_004104 [Exophiala xenobiotica]|nr:hypothetical protein LTR47_004104 [Exophiala xenobiotica]KAK5246756.1 hypothetical protein LTS06_008016 [Exophiala xenobiotica]KAK5379833.1 hypothetical protein LTR11_003461 [Exophiala xenobiotica]KAK5386920.1 hypothetical protein LTS03_002194 [Exophiala xenobiotica]
MTTKLLLPVIRRGHCRQHWPPGLVISRGQPITPVSNTSNGRIPCSSWQEALPRKTPSSRYWLPFFIGKCTSKNDPEKALKVELGQLHAENNCVDITKLLVAYALRIDVVEQKTWEDLITVVSQRPSKRFIWKHRDWPVFFALTRGERLDFFKPAKVDQQRRFLRRAAGLTGMPQLPVSHDIRRGAAADISSLESSTNPEGVRRSLSHTPTAVDKGVTDKYAGRLKGDSWAARLDDSVEADDPFGPQFAQQPYVKRKIATKEIDKYCTTNKLDVHDCNARHKARQELEKS